MIKEVWEYLLYLYNNRFNSQSLKQQMSVNDSVFLAWSMYLKNKLPTAVNTWKKEMVAAKEVVKEWIGLVSL